MADCCICGRELRGTASVCVSCEQHYGLPKLFSLWPEWAKALQNFEREERRYWQAEGEQLGNAGTQLGPPPLRTRGETDADGIPLGPYDNEADNAAYRRANGLPDSVSR